MGGLSAILRSVVRCFLGGVLVVLPLVITAIVVVWVAGIVTTMLGPDTLLGRGLERLGYQFTQDRVVAYAIGWALVLGVIYLVGLAAEVGAKRFIQSRVDAIASRVPVLGGVYGTAKQLVGMLDKTDQADMKGMRPVWCSFGEDSGAVFLALQTTSDVIPLDGRDYCMVIVPTAPVPFGGGLVMVPTDKVKPAELSVDQFVRLYVSMGVSGTKDLAVQPG